MVERLNRYPKYQEMASISRQLTYRERWFTFYRERQWDVLMKDYSLLQFQISPDLKDAYSLGYMPSPIVAPYVSDAMPEYWDSYYPSEEEREQFARERQFEEAENVAHVTPVRFDYDPRGYQAGVHPAAHLHIGESNEIRIACRTCLSPVGFVCLVLRLLYPKKWHEMVDSLHEEHGHGDLSSRLLGDCGTVDATHVTHFFDRIQPWLVFSTADARVLAAPIQGGAPASVHKDRRPASTSRR